LHHAGIPEAEVAGISAHGTGTVYNDSMEMLAFKSVFEQPRPTFSVKGALGHTMGAAGVIEVIISLQALQSGKIPPNIGSSDIDSLAQGWVSDQAQELSRDCILKTNSGFGGINAALILKV